eukprot:4153477-Heterocapsa_arctica.AAC.1
MSRPQRPRSPATRPSACSRPSGTCRGPPRSGGSMGSHGPVAAATSQALPPSRDDASGVSPAPSLPPAKARRSISDPGGRLHSPAH